MRDEGLQAGTPRVTISQVAAAAGVSTPTVSRVLNDTASVTPETKAKVEAAIAELNYRPSALARALSYGRTMSIGAVVPFVTHPSAVERMRGVIDGLRTSPYPLTLYDVEHPSHRAEHLDAIASTPPAGAIIAMQPTEDELHILHGSDTPIVFVDASVPGFSSVSVDHRCGGRIATEHLLDLGHERIAFLGDNEDNPFGFMSSALRHQGFNDAMAAAGLPIDETLVLTSAHGRDEARSLAAGALESAQPPTAFVAASDTQAFGAIDAARGLGLDVPGDVSVIGFDDIPASAHLSLTTVRQPLEESGRLAAEILMQAIGSPGHPEVHELLPLELVIRDTTRDNDHK